MDADGHAAIGIRLNLATFRRKFAEGARLFGIVPLGMGIRSAWSRSAISAITAAPIGTPAASAARPATASASSAISIAATLVVAATATTTISTL
jgi:hypothetical protein